MVRKRSATMAGSPQRTRVFISYSHNDARYLKRLQQHLSYYERNNLIDYWDDTKLAVGDDWERKIAEAIEHARVCILLVSADYLASSYVTDKELPQMLACAKNEAALICTVVLSPCGFMRTALSQFQAINDASRPLSGMTRHKKENVWHSLAEKVANTLSAAQPADIAGKVQPADTMLPSMQPQPNGQNRTQPSAARPASMTIEEALTHGENLIKEGKYAAAADLLAGPVRLTPENLRAWALYEKALRQQAQDWPREWAKLATGVDRERLARGVTIVRTYTDQLKPQHRLLDRRCRFQAGTPTVSSGTG